MIVRVPGFKACFLTEAYDFTGPLAVHMSSNETV